MPVRSSTHRGPPPDHAEALLDARLYRTPDPREVYKLACSHGFDAAAERYGWHNRTYVGRLVSQGRALIVGERAETARRGLSPEREAEIVAAVHELGGVAYAARAYGLGEGLVRTICREQGAYPRASRKRADMAAAEARLSSFQARKSA